MFKVGAEANGKTKQLRETIQVSFSDTPCVYLVSVHYEGVCMCVCVCVCYVLSVSETPVRWLRASVGTRELCVLAPEGEGKQDGGRQTQEGGQAQ